MPVNVGACTACTDSEGVPPECENMFHLFLRLQDERGNAQITVSVDQNVRFLWFFSTVPSLLLICHVRAEQLTQGVIPG